MNDTPPDAMCQDVLTPWGFTVYLGELPSGLYEAHLDLTYVYYQETYRCASKSFTVSRANSVFIAILYNAYLTDEAFRDPDR